MYQSRLLAIYNCLLHSRLTNFKFTVREICFLFDIDYDKFFAAYFHKHFVNVSALLFNKGLPVFNQVVPCMCSKGANNTYPYTWL